MKEEIQNSNEKQKFKLYIKQFYAMLSNIEKIQKVKI